MIFNTCLYRLRVRGMVAGHPNSSNWPIAWATALSIAASLAGCGDDRRTAKPERNLNVLVVVLDTTRADAVGVSGSELARTPTLDGLAEQGIVFTKARSTSAWTVPSHGSLFTGLYPSNHGAHHEHPRLESEQHTLAELLSPSHQTAAFSENSFIQKGTGYGQGFEHFEEMWRERENQHEPPDTLGKIRDWLNQRERDRPFFVFVNLMTPHLPYDPPSRYTKEFIPEQTPPDVLESLRHLGDGAAQRYMIGTLELGDATLGLLRRLYLAEVAYADEQVGELVDMLRDDAVLDETLVVVVGDHGENLGEHQLMEHQFSLHETLLRVPMILRLPDTFPPGTRSDAPVQLVDLMPTVIDLLGVGRSHLDGLDGQSLLGEAPSETRPILAEYMRPVMQRRSYRELDPGFDFDRFDRRLKSLQIGHLKLIASDDGEQQLYDVEADPGETQNLASERPEQLDLLRRRLDAWLGANWEPTQRGELQGIDEATERELRSLGYVR